MESSSRTRGQLSVRYEKLFKRIEVVKVSDVISKMLVDVAKEPLDIFPVVGFNALSSLPNWNKVEPF